MITSLGLEGVIIENPVFKRAFTCMLYAICQLFFLRKYFKAYCFQACIHMYAICQLFFLRKILKNTVSRRALTCMLFVIFFFLRQLRFSDPMHWIRYNVKTCSKFVLCQYHVESNALKHQTQHLSLFFNFKFSQWRSRVFKGWLIVHCSHVL